MYIKKFPALGVHSNHIKHYYMNELIEKHKKELDNMIALFITKNKSAVYNWHINSIKEILEAEVGYWKNILLKKETELDKKSIALGEINRLTTIINNLK